MKVCSPQLGLSPDSTLGGEIYDHLTIKGYTKKGIKVFVYLPNGRNYDSKLKNLTVTYSPFKHIVPPWTFSLISLPYIIRTYRKERFDILRIHSARFLGLAGIVFHFLYPNVPIVVSEVTPKHNILFYPIEKTIYDLSSAIIVQSKSMQEMLVRNFKQNKSKVHVTGGGNVVLSSHSKVSLKFQAIKKDDFVILFMGILEKRKNPAFLLSVLDEVIKTQNNVKLVYIGNGQELNNLKKIAQSHNLLNSIIFVKEAFGDKKSSWLKRMDLFAMPSKAEGFGLSVTEAMSYKKPVILSNIAPFREIVENEVSGYLLPLKVKVWSEKIKMLHESPATRSKVGISAKTSVNKNFNWNNAYEKNFNVLRKILI